MLPKERVIAALRFTQPDRIPIGESAIDYTNAEQALGRRGSGKKQRVPMTRAANPGRAAVWSRAWCSHYRARCRARHGIIAGECRQQLGRTQPWGYL